MAAIAAPRWIQENQNERAGHRNFRASSETGQVRRQACHSSRRQPHLGGASVRRGTPDDSEPSPSLAEVFALRRRDQQGTRWTKGDTPFCGDFQGSRRADWWWSFSTASWYRSWY